MQDSEDVTSIDCNSEGKIPTDHHHELWHNLKVKSSMWYKWVFNGLSIFFYCRQGKGIEQLDVGLGTITRVIVTRPEIN